VVDSSRNAGSGWHNVTHFSGTRNCGVYL
jgi:hypothetical protein